MINQTINFRPSITPDNNVEKEVYIVFQNTKVLIKEHQEKPLYILDELPENIQNTKHSLQHLGLINNYNCKIIGLQEEVVLPEKFDFLSIRSLFGKLPEDQLLIIGRANQIITWAVTHNFCGKCGNKTQNKPTELALQCPVCETTYYPTISPAIIVAVVKDGKILLGHSKRFRGKFYSVLAGFVEIGETFEACVAREVEEEAGVKVKNIKYFGSQPWPFPNSMMIGFTAEWASGEIELRDDELDDAGWFAPDEMPVTPGTFSIAGRLIEWFKEKYS